MQKKGRKKVGKQVSSLTKSKGFADVSGQKVLLASFVGEGCDIQCEARRIREGDAGEKGREIGDVEALL